MQKRLFLISPFVLMVALAVSGCGDDDGPADTTSGDAQAEASATEAGADTGVADAGGDADKLLRGRIDRAGRPLVALALISAENRNAWNEDQGSYDVPLKYDRDFQTNLVKVDQWDGTDNWAGGAIPAPNAPVSLSHPLGPVFRTDALLLDVSKPFGPASYLAIEMENAGISGAHTTCGGRWLNDDAVDRMLSVMVKKAATGVSDGVAAPTKLATETFPYLAPPN